LKEATRIEQWQQEVYTALHNIDAAWVTTGTFDVARIPDLDASKITSGTFDVARIPNLDASKITSGTFALDRIPRLDLTKMPLGSSGYFLKGQGTADPIYALLTAADIPALDASKITTGTFDAARIPDLDASKITSGIFDLARIPNIDWSRISANFPRTIAELLSDHDLTHHPLSILPRMDLSHMPLGASGYFLKGQGTADPVYALLTATDIPSLDASKITSGRFELARLPTSATANRFLVVRTANVDPVYDALVAGDIPSLDASKITSGTFDVARIPGLDASKIVSGTFDVARIPDLDASKITSGRFPLARLTDGLSGYFLKGQGVGVDPVYALLTASDIPSLDASKITSGTFDAARIPSLDASKITTGTFDLARIPRLDLTKMPLGTSGYFLKGQGASDPIYALLTSADIPSLDASKITTGTFDAARIPSLDASKITTGTFDAALIPNLDASKITSGTFDSALIPSLDASKITTGTFDAARIPNLDASKITSGRFALARLPTSSTANRFLAVRTANADPVYDALGSGDIPSLDASKITSGTFDAALIPSLDASKITTGIFDVARIPNLDASKITSGTFDVARIPNLDASKITSGRFTISRLPDGSSGYVLVGQGSGYDLAWRDISGIAGVITNSQHGTKTSIPFAHHGDWGHYGNIPTSAPTGALERAYVDSANLYVHDGTSWVLRATKDWNSLINKPSTFPPSTHASTHASGGSDPVSLDASQITSGRLSLSRIPTSATANRVLLVRTANADPVYDALGSGDIPSLDASKITSGTFDAALIPNLDASKITSGTFDSARIPSLDASKITTGTFDAALIPSLDASKITSGRFPLARLTDGLSGYFLKGQGVGVDPVYALLTASDIPNLDASKITSGTFDSARIPNLDASKITTGTFDAARIPNLDASKITSGRFALARLPTSATANRFLAVRTANADPIYDALVAGDIPGLDASKIVSGTFDVARIPNLDASKITSGRFPVSRLPDGTSGYVLVGQGAGYDLTWKDISEIAGVITDSQHGTKTGIPFAHHGDWGHYGKIPTSAPTGVSERAYVDSANLYVHDGTSWVLRATKDWNSLINKPSTFPPSAHTHSRSDVTDFWSSPFWTNIPDKPSTYPPSAHTHARADVTDFWSSPFWGNIPDKPSTFPPSAHASSHASGGADAVSLDASQITSGRLSLSRIPTSATANRILLVRTANGDPVYDALGSGDIPSLDASKITSGTFDAALIPSLDASKITSGTFDAALIPSLDASKITTGTFDSARIPSLDASKITSGRFPLARLTDGLSGYFLKGQGVGVDPVYALLTASDIPSLDASKITSGTFDAALIPNLDASKITTGTFDAARIPNLDASKITSGRFALARLPTSSTANRFLAVRTANADPVYDALGSGDIPSLDASKITSGRFSLSRLPTSSTANYVLIVRTANGDPVYDALGSGDIPNLDASKITTGTFDAALIPNLDASKITSGRFPLARLTDGLSGYFLKGQGVGVDPVYALLTASDIPNLDASKITTGTFDAALIPNLDASKITSGTFDSARIPSLDASKITSGRFSLSRLPTSSTANYVLIVRTANADPVYDQVDWNTDIKNKPSSFTPSAHASTHSYGGSDLVTNLSSLSIQGTAVIDTSRALQGISGVKQTLLPQTDNTYNFGSSSYRWAAIYATNATFSGGTVSIAPSGATHGLYFTSEGGDPCIRSDAANLGKTGTSSYPLYDVYSINGYFANAYPKDGDSTGYLGSSSRRWGSFYAVNKNASFKHPLHNPDRYIVFKCTEAPKVTIEDWGVAELKDGEASVSLSEEFVALMSDTAEYAVFLTPEGECNGLYVAEKGFDGFKVKELNGGKSNIRFSWQVKAIRIGDEETPVLEEPMPSFTEEERDKQDEWVKQRNEAIRKKEDDRLSRMRRKIVQYREARSK